jgi:nitrate reductase gamma subunit
MPSLSWLQIVTVLAYIFVIVAYSVKVQKYFRMPRNLRWDLYPIPHEMGYKHGGSYLEEPEFWKRPRHINRLRDIMEMAKQYFTMAAYIRRSPSYWLGLFPWHIGFYAIVTFHCFVWLSAIVMKATGIEVAAASANAGGQVLYYLTIVLALSSFILGTIGSITLLLKRIFDERLRDYASPQNYFNYAFCLVLFVSGLISWGIGDGTFGGYREFWVGIFSLHSVGMGGVEAAHLILFALFLFYLPFTRSTHYITVPIAYLKIRSSDAPNFGAPDTDQKLQEALSHANTWSAPHIQSGKSWGEVVTNLPEDCKGVNK